MLLSYFQFFAGLTPPGANIVAAEVVICVVAGAADVVAQIGGIAVNLEPAGWPPAPRKYSASAIKASGLAAAAAVVASDAGDLKFARFPLMNAAAVAENGPAYFEVKMGQDDDSHYYHFDAAAVVD